MAKTQKYRYIRNQHSSPNKKNRIKTHLSNADVFSERFLFYDAYDINESE